MASNQQHWELMTSTSEFSLLELEPKGDLDHLMDFATDSTVSSGGDVGRSAEGEVTGSSSSGSAGDGAGSSVLGGASSIAMSFGVDGSSANVSSLLSGSASSSSSSPYDTLMLADQKPQIRHDCMWAGVCADQSHPEKHSGGCGGCARQNLQQQQTSLGSSAGSLVLVPSKDIPKIVPGAGEQPAEMVVGGSIVKSGPAGSVLANRVSTVSNALPSCAPVLVKPLSNPASLLTPFKATQSAARIPAGSSLLIKRQQQQLSTAMLAQNSRQSQLTPPTSSPSSSSDSGVSSGEGSEVGEQNLRMVRVPHLPRGSFLAAREQEARSIAAQNHARPDTPLSLDDDPLEFKHNLDLVATCTIGSNQQSLLHTASSLSPAASSSSSSSPSSSTNSTTAIPTTATSASSGTAAMSGVESRTGALYGRLGGNCSCGGISNSNNISSIGHTTQCYVNYLQDTSSVDDVRIKQLREQLLLLDDPYAVLPNHHHYYHHPHHHYNGHHHHPHQLRPDSPDSQLEQLLIDLREIEGSSCLLDDQHKTSTASLSIGMNDGSPLSSVSSSLHHQQQHQQQQQHHQQHQQQQRSPLSLAPCGGELSGGAHATCSKECCWSSLELSHHLASPSTERRRRLQFAHRRRSITVRGWMSDDDEDEEDDLLKQLEEEDDFFEKHFEQSNGGNVVAVGNAATRGYTNSSSWEDEEEEDEEEEEEDEEESGEDEEDKDEQEEDVDEEDEEEEMDDANEESMYGDGSSRSRSRSRTRTSRHRYHSQYNHHRRVARSYRPYDVEVYNSNGKHQKKQSTNNVLSAGGVNTIIAGSGASLKSSMLGSKISSTSCNGNGNLNNSTVTSAVQQPTGGSGANSYQATHFGDHSYTRPKGGYNMNELGVQTPSDSDEEIDVVSVGDKNLPTNPTERDMRHMQSEVASKIRTAASRNTGNGSHPYGTGSSHYQRQHHLADGQRLHHHHHSLGGIYPTPAGSTTISGANTPLPTRSGGASVASSPPPAPCTSTGLLRSSSSSSGTSSRKRAIGGGGSSSSKRSSNASKRMRLAHSKRGGSGGSGGGDSSNQALAEELDTVEKRNLHNNLERQRRIGLKNLFEELKRQIPTLRDKDRAPKVNILREAAALCTRLIQEAEQVNELRQQQMKLYERVRYLRASIHSQHRHGTD
ncbi:uncharacterized protein LOC118510267 [Anopheles stephensi]|uniref:uncharacterized protein LOC118510267 n=1 Tax=Anopheles stephensi TaxID=30069 RepID=UPI0016587D9A|nr:uncharacterized protein LOC118510267 [Anopheles stephensi]XP_035907768.1 uncharacterized protein LOC118510267 [Anopheles stephensi]XP_035907779.1 uncharacterized protein LOC118510267 [Anopheles stephensi]XP_035907787.1 uncharacterized protein LOC118510267 [Anopheles stephensi]